MNKVRITPTELIVNWITVLDDTTDLSGVPDGVYPFDSPPDQWAVVIGEQAVNWAADWGKAWEMYSEALRTHREHALHCPADLAHPLDREADDYGLPEVTL